jgi:hypothetical protein
MSKSLSPSTPAPATSLPFAKHLATLESVKPALDDAVAAVVERAKTLADKEGKRQAPQEAVAAFAHIRELMNTLKKAEEACKTALLAHLDAGGPVEPGEYALSVSVAGRRNVDWEGIAIAASEKLAKLEGRPFNAAHYTATIKEATVPTPVTTLKVIKVAGA